MGFHFSLESALTIIIALLIDNYMSIGQGKNDQLTGDNSDLLRRPYHKIIKGTSIVKYQIPLIKY